MDCRVLKLSQAYEPIEIITWRKAFKLIALGKAEVIKEYDKTIRTFQSSFKFPAVIRLVKSFQRPKGYVRFNKRNVFIRDRMSCLYCGAEGTMDSLTLDHIIPRSKGGKTSWINCVACCKTCNIKKGNKTPQEAGMTLKKQPTAPDWLPLFFYQLFLNETPEQWIDFMKKVK
jgi:5-methylcytosine-specific restriction endonuclease McrA